MAKKPGISLATQDRKITEFKKDKRFIMVIVKMLHSITV